MNKKSKNIIIFGQILLIVLLGIVPLLWFMPEHLIIGADVGFKIDPLNLLNKQAYVWDKHYTTGTNISMTVLSATYILPMALLQKAGLSLIHIEKLWFVFLFMFSGLAFYLFVFQLCDNSGKNTMPLTAAVFYMFNNFAIIVWESVDRAFLSNFIAVPLILAFYKLGVSKERNNYSYSILIGIISVFYISAIGNPPTFFVGIFFMAVFILGSLISGVLRKNKAEILNKIKFTASAFLLVIAFNCWLILPYINELFYSLKNAPVKPIDWVASSAKYSSLWHVLRLANAWQWYEGWNGELYSPYAQVYLHNFLFIIFGCGIALLAYAAFFLKRTKYTFFFMLLTMAGTILAAGYAAPFGGIYKWATIHVPFFWIFRSTIKFNFLIIIGYSFLIAAALNYFYAGLHNKILAKLLIALFMVLNIGYNYPLFFGKIFPRPQERKSLPVKHVKIPSYIKEASEWINEQHGDFRIFLLPMKWYENYNWGCAGKLLAYEIFRRGVLFNYDDVASQFISYPAGPLVALSKEVIYKGLTPYAGGILSIMNVGYILQRNDLIYNFFGEEDSPAFIGGRLALQKDISFEKSFGAWDFYKIDRAIPHIYGIGNIALVRPGVEALLPISNTEHVNTPNFVFLSVDEKPNGMLSDYAEAVFSYNCDITGISGLKNEKDFRYYSLEISKSVKKDDSGNEYEYQKGFCPPELWRQNEIWHLMKEGQAAIVINNNSAEEIEGGLALKIFCFTPKAVIISLNNEQIEAVSEVPAGKKEELVIEGVKLKPGENILDMYTPHSSDKIDDFLHNQDQRNMFFAFYGDPVLGEISYSGHKEIEFFTPKAGKYRAVFYPDADTRNKAINETGEAKAQLTVNGENKILEKENGNLYSIISLPKGKNKISAGFGSGGNFPVIGFEPMDYEGTEMINMEVKENNPVKYEVAAADIKRPFFLVLNESFDRRWKVRIEDENINEQMHFKINSYANAWLIEKTGNYTMLIYYYPQRFYAAGRCMSAIFITGALFVGVLFFRNYSRRGSIKIK